jgi:hypothetical protein
MMNPFELSILPGSLQKIPSIFLFFTTQDLANNHSVVDRISGRT